jgi:CRISPR/Cas system-associated protein Cas10 (large subunit of type III CRISPR-Cas system)
MGKNQENKDLLTTFKKHSYPKICEILKLYKFKKNYRILKLQKFFTTYKWGIMYMMF